MDKILEFKQQCTKRIANNAKNKSLQDSAKLFADETLKSQYSYNFSWMGRPIIQYPQDMIAMQEIIWEVKPDLIIETGIAHGGSIIMYASLLELIGKGQVLGIDIEIREHNRIEIEKHPMFKRITMFEGSSISDEMAAKVKDYAKNYNKILVVLDSNHTHSHVLKELELYAPLVSKESYCVVFDTIVEDLPAESFPDRPWGKGNNPKTAAYEFLKTHDEFVIDKSIQNKLLITVAPDGYLKRIK
ncbi:MAG: cephalosporin hydroxylase family protein [Planctomycetes bacterium]|nr:cephalosporin hydroxylase family protein [Planctomycetota bacterium]MCK5472992.1 cephalosporin hydroxylase family protein [Planctomycetota bacterium]